MLDQIRHALIVFRQRFGQPADTILVPASRVGELVAEALALARAAGPYLKADVTGTDLAILDEYMGVPIRISLGGRLAVAALKERERLQLPAVFINSIQDGG